MNNCIVKQITTVYMQLHSYSTKKIKSVKMVRNKQIAKNSRMAKSLKYCPHCHKITTFGYVLKNKHSSCQNCGYSGMGALFVRWCNIRLVPIEWQTRKCVIKTKILNNLIFSKKDSAEYFEAISALDKKSRNKEIYILNQIKKEVNQNGQIRRNV